MKGGITITGTQDVIRTLEQITPRHAKNIMRATVHDMAKEVRDEAKAGMPEDQGDMKRATKHKRERGAPGQLESTVRVGPKGFYWRFLEYGDGPDGVAYDFFRNATHEMRSQMMSRFLQSFGRKLEAAAAREAKKKR